MRECDDDAVQAISALARMLDRGDISSLSTERMIDLLTTVDMMRSEIIGLAGEHMLAVWAREQRSRAESLDRIAATLGRATKPAPQPTERPVEANGVAAEREVW